LLLPFQLLSKMAIAQLLFSVVAFFFFLTYLLLNWLNDACVSLVAN